MNDNSMEEKSDSKEVLSIDELTERVGPFGLYQVRLQFLFFLLMLPLSYQVLIMYFIAESPPWQCKHGSKVCLYKGLLTPNMGKRFQKRCYLNRSEWEYSTSKDLSIVTEFDLICDKEVVAFIANSILFVGWTIGGFVLPYFSDHLGRKTILFPSTFGIILCGIISSIAKSIWLFIICRFSIGFFQAGVVNIFVLATEVVGQSYRSLSGTMIWFYFTAALLIMTLKAYILQNWRHLELFCSLPFLPMLLTWGLVPESTRWLRMKGRLHEAMALFTKMARVNGREFKNKELQLSTQSHLKISKSTIADLFQPSSVAIYTIIQGAAWFVCGISFYGISLASKDLGGDQYGDFVLTSIVEFPANALVVILTDRCGRRPTTIVNILLAGISCIGIVLLPSTPAIKGFKYGRVGLGMLGKFATTIYFNSFYLWSAELNATVVRVQAIGLLIAVSRVGAAFSPFIMNSLKYINKSLPFVSLGLLNLCVGFLCLHLRETKNTPSPDTIDDSRMLMKKDAKPPH